MLESLLPYQKQWINDESQIKLMEKSRQIGISWATAYSIVRKQSHPTATLDAWISSRDITQAKLFLEDCTQFATNLNQATVESSAPFILPAHQQRSCFTLEFTNKKRIHSLSSNPNAQAGKRGSRILDEFALHPNPQQLYNIAFPGITWGGQLEIISTHRGSHNFFNILIEEILSGNNPKKISHHRVTLQDALDQGFLKTLKSKLPPSDPRQTMDDADYFNFIRSGCHDETSFLQEYMCQPTDYDSCFLSPNLIASCEYTDDNWEYSIDKLRLSPYDLYLGIDVGRKRDLTVFWLIEAINAVYFTRYILPLKDMTFPEQEKFLHNFVALPNLRRICIDQTAMGIGFTDRAKIIFSPSRVEGLHFTSPLKEVLAYTVKTALETRTLFLPPKPEIRADLLSLKRAVTKAGNIRLNADHTDAGHADYFWALALCLHAAKSPVTTPYYESFARVDTNEF